jgi:hypothetical protein
MYTEFLETLWVQWALVMTGVTDGVAAVGFRPNKEAYERAAHLAVILASGRAPQPYSHTCNHYWI